MTVECRNPVFNAHGNIDCEISHPRLGWIRFTASADDPEEYGKQLFAQLSNGTVAPYMPAPIEPASPQDVSAEQVRLQLQALGLTPSQSDAFLKAAAAL